MKRTSFERRVSEELRVASPPHADEARRRAWQVVQAAHVEQPPLRERRHGRLLAAAMAAAALLAVLALTPAGATVGGWIGEVVDPAPKTARRALGSLPARGRLLVVAEAGPWVVQANGARRRLGAYGDASWSPGGLYVAAVRGRELVALEPGGAVRWTLPTARRAAVPRWSPDGFRIAYRSGRDLYVTVADNSARRLIARRVQPVPAAWRPGQAAGRQVLAYARGARIHIVPADPAAASERASFRTPPGPRPRELWWSAGGRLVAVSKRAVRVHTARGRLLRSVPLPGGLRVSGSALAPDGRRLALIASAPGARSSELLLMGAHRGAAPRRRLGGLGRLQGLAWSIDGRVLVAGLPDADQWLFLRLRGEGGLESVERIRAHFGGRRPARAQAFPRPAGWCYAEPQTSDPVGRRPCSTGAP